MLELSSAEWFKLVWRLTRDVSSFKGEKIDPELPHVAGVVRKDGWVHRRGE